ncbi:MAG: polysaccharide biosynthesis/export family protein [Hyphomicrobiales bacterium]
MLISACGVERQVPVTALVSPQDNVQLPNGAKSIENDLQIVESLPAPENTRGGADSVLLVGDLLEVDVFQVDELDKTVQIDSSGRISMPLIGRVAAAGKTVGALESELERLYEIKHLQSPDIAVLVTESKGQQVTLNGEFLTPGVYPSSSNTTLLQAVALARGLSPIADTGKIFVYRDFQGKKLVANYNLKKIQQGQAIDPKIFGGDIIVAFSSKTKLAQKNLKETLGVAANAVRAIPLL